MRTVLDTVDDIAAFVAEFRRELDTARRRGLDLHVSVGDGTVLLRLAESSLRVYEAGIKVRRAQAKRLAVVTDLAHDEIFAALVASRRQVSDEAVVKAWKAARMAGSGSAASIVQAAEALERSAEELGRR